GAGIDLTRDFESRDALGSGIAVTARSTEPVSVSCSLEPYGAASNVITLSAVAAQAATESPTDPADATAPQGGCSAAPSLSLAALLALLFRRAAAAGARAASGAP